MGRLTEARSCFEEFMKSPAYSTILDRIAGLQVVRFLELLLDQAEYQTVLDVRETAIERANEKGWQREIGLLVLSRGVALSYVQSAASDDAANHLNSGIELLRKTGHKQYVAEALIARGSFHRRFRHFEAAKQDIEEARDLTEETGQLVTGCDVRSTLARLYLDQNDMENGFQCLTELRHLVSRTEYHLRDHDVSLLEAWTKALAGDEDGSRLSLDRLRGVVKEIGYKALDQDILHVRSLLR